MKIYGYIYRHFHEHHRKYFLGMFGSFAVVKMIILLIGMLGSFSLVHHYTSADFVDPISTCAGAVGIPESECQTLLSFYNATNGDQRDLASNRGDIDNICGNWYGVTCNDGHVTQINLYTHIGGNGGDGNNLSGTANLSGLSHLTMLNLSNNRLTSVDVTHNSALIQLYLYNNMHSNPLTSIDLSNNTALNTLYLNNNQLTSIDLSNNTALNTLFLNNNQLTNIDLSNNSNLNYLFLGDNQLTNIDLSNNSNLNYLFLGDNQLTNIDLSNNPVLTQLYLSNNQLTGITLSHNPDLAMLFLGHNQLTSIDLSNNPDLITLNIDENQLTSIDLSNNIALANLSLNSNQLTNIDLSNNIALANLSLNSNQLTNIDLSTLTNLYSFGLIDNQLTTINLSNNINVHDLELSGNHLTSIIGLETLGGIQRGSISNNNLPNQYITDNEQFFIDHNIAYTALPSQDQQGDFWLTGYVLDMWDVYSGTMIPIVAQYGYDGTFYNYGNLTVTTPLDFELVDMPILGSASFGAPEIIPGYGGPGDMCYTEFANNTGAYLVPMNTLVNNLMPYFLSQDGNGDWEMDLGSIQSGMTIPFTQYTTEILNSTGLTQLAWIFAEEMYAMGQGGVATSVATALNQGTPASTLLVNFCKNINYGGEHENLNTCFVLGDALSSMILDLAFNQQEPQWIAYMDNLFTKITDRFLYEDGGTYYMDISRMGAGFPNIPVSHYEAEILASTGSTQRIWEVAELMYDIGEMQQQGGLIQFATGIAESLANGAKGNELIPTICETMGTMNMGSGALNECFITDMAIVANGGYFGLDDIPNCGAKRYTAILESGGYISNTQTRGALIFGRFPYSPLGIDIGVSYQYSGENYFEDQNTENNQIILHVNMLAGTGVSCFSTGVTSTETIHGNPVEIYLSTGDVCESVVGVCIEGNMYAEGEGTALETYFDTAESCTTTCGNGVLEGWGGEQCDDGDNNGIPGYCNFSCDGTIALPACTGTRMNVSCSTITGSTTCNNSYSAIDEKQCGYSLGQCRELYSCIVPEVAPNCMGSPLSGACADIASGELTNASTQCSLFYSATDNVQCTYNTNNGGCQNSGAINSCTPTPNGVYITYNTNSAGTGVEAEVHLPNQDCSVLNNNLGTNYAFTKNGTFFFQIMCPSISTGRTIQMRAKVSRLPDIFSVLVPNSKTLEFADIWYEDNGRLFDPTTRFGATGTGDLQKAIYTTELNDVTSTNNEEVTLNKNTNLEIVSDASIIYKETILVSDDEKAEIAIPADTALISQLTHRGMTQPFVGTFIAPSKEEDSGIVDNLEATVGTSKRVEEIYKFGDADGSRTISALEGDINGTRKSFTITMETDAAIGAVVDIYSSENGEDRVLHTGATVETGEGNTHVVVIKTDHLSYYALTTNTNTPVTTSPSHGGGAALSKDICPVNRDCSDSYYDKVCGICTPAHQAANLEAKKGISCTSYTSELNDAYAFAYLNGITTLNDCEKADLKGTLIRAHMAKMLSNFAIKVLQMQPDSGKACNFGDIGSLSSEMKFYTKIACQLGLMGLNADGTVNAVFNPEETVTRAQFGTVLSRIIRGDTYNGGDVYYTKHLDALKNANIMTKIDNPDQKELRGRVMLMFQRIIGQVPVVRDSKTNSGSSLRQTIKDFFLGS